MQSKATTVDEYLASLPEDRRNALETVRNVVRENIDDGIREGMEYGMIVWYVAREVFPEGYHANPKQPLPYASLASQKNYMSLYMFTMYGEGGQGEKWFREKWARTGKKLDMGKSCIRFKAADDLALDVIAEAIRRIPAKKHVETYLQNRPSSKSKKKA